MTLTDKILSIILAIMSIIAIIVTIYDKLAALRGERRIPEATLLTIGFLLGGAAMFVTMLLIRHKTRHARFMLGLPAAIALHIALAAFYFLKLRPTLP